MVVGDGRPGRWRRRPALQKGRTDRDAKEGVLMPPCATRLRLATIILGLWAVTAVPTTKSSLASGPRSVDPAQIVPLDQLAPGHRETVAEVIRDHTIHRKGATDSFPCNGQIYLGLVDEPAITLALWKDLSPSPVEIRQLAPGRYMGSDGAGASATWEFVYRNPRLHVLLCNLDYTSPRGNARLQGRIVLVVWSSYHRASNGDPWVKHDIGAFVKVDSKGWKTLARTVRPILEKVLEDQVQEAGLFVSLMGRLVEMYPNWACEVATTKSQASPETKQAFRDVVEQNRRKGAFTGRPKMVGEAATGTTASRSRY
jgi:hypothetical protein